MMASTGIGAVHLSVGPLALDDQASRLYGSTQFQEHPMLALFVILGFVAVLGVINVIEFGRVD